MAELWFLKIDGIPGESTLEAHAGEIEIASWSWGLTSTSSADATLSRRTKPTLEDFDFEAALSSASPLLLDACASGQRYASAVLSGVRDGAEAVDFVRYALGDVVVSSVHHGDSEVDVVTEMFSLGFGSIEVTYLATGQLGEPGQPVVFTYDVSGHRI